MRKTWKHGMVMLSVAAVMSFSALPVYAEESEASSDEGLAVYDAGRQAEDEDLNGWQDRGEDGKYYYIDGVAVTNTIMEIDGSLYAFDSDGRLYVNTFFSMDVSGQEIRGLARADGSLYRDEWYTDASEFRYYFGPDGVLPDEGILTIDGEKYFFHSDGSVSVNGRITYEGKTYVSSESGALLHDQWSGAGSEYANSLYLTEDCSAATGYYVVDGVAYLFDEVGQREHSVIRKYDGHWYVTDSLGVATEIPFKEGWNTLNGYTYYVKEGELLRSQVVRIGDAYYGFDYAGRLHKDICFQSSGEKYYLAGIDGKLYTADGWMKVNGKTYYCYSDASLAHGIVTIGGKKYLFGELEAEKTDSCLIVSDRRSFGYYENVYYTDAQGVVTQMKNGWNRVNGEYYYLENNKLIHGCIKNIDGAYYGFDDGGRMYDDTTFELLEITGISKYTINQFRAKKGGKLYRNEWFRDKATGRWYYYLTGCNAAEDVRTISKKTYIFEDHQMVTSPVYRSAKGTEYVIDRSGEAKQAKKGWNSSQGSWFYLKDGAFVRNGVIKSGASWYYFDETGKMIDGERVYDPGKGLYVRAKEDGVLCHAEWYGDEYYGADCFSKDGLVTVDKKKYYFMDGKKVKGRDIMVGDKLLRASDTGVISDSSITGMVYNDTERREMIYSKNGAVVKNSWQVIGKNKYYFGEDGVAYRNGVYLINGELYLFHKDGTVAAAGWNIMEDSGSGCWYYVQASGALATGAQEINGKSYYFDPESGIRRSGLVNTEEGTFFYATDGSYAQDVTGRTGILELQGTGYYTGEGDKVSSVRIGEVSYINRDEGYIQIGENRYHIDGSGIVEKNRIVKIWAYGLSFEPLEYYELHLFTANGKEWKNGWYKLNNRWYYAVDGVLVSGQAKTINGKVYFFDPDGVMQTQDYLDPSTRILYRIGSSGVVSSYALVKNGWTLADGRYHYYKNDKPYNGWVGKYYIDHGRMLQNEISPDGYWLTADGSYQSTAGWAEYQDGSFTARIYVQKGGKLVRNAWKKIDGKWYYFDDDYALNREYVRQLDGIYYIFDGNGAYVKTLGKKLPNGWVKAGTEWFFFDQGEILFGEYVIDGKSYSFLQSKMLKNSFGEEADSAGDCAFWHISNGAAALGYSGWKKINGAWYYFGTNNMTGCRSFVNVGGKQYFAEYAGKNLAGETAVYTFDREGTLIAEKSTMNGWVESKGDRYYFRDGQLQRNCLVTDGGSVYLIGDEKLVKSGSAAAYDEYGNLAWYHTDANGRIVTNTWITENGVKSYYGTDGRRLTGVQKIKGTVYYFG